jgi:hypothetical protein
MAPVGEGAKRTMGCGIIFLTLRHDSEAAPPFSDMIMR